MLSIAAPFALALLPAPALQRESAEPPNVVLILADDLGYGDVGCFNDESKIPTPHLDRLAAEGLRLTDAHSPSSVCTPTRYGILTGRYAWRTALTKSVLWPWDPPLIEEERLTLPELLRAEGYRTACIGKWHLGWDWPLDDESRVTAELDGHTWEAARRAEIGERVNWDRAIAGGPLAHGFDHYFGDDVPNFPPYAFLEDERVLTRPTASKPEGMFGHPGPAAPGWDLSLVMPTLAQRAASWIEAHAGEGGAAPFFLYLPLTAPHTPIAPSPHFAGRSEAGAYGDFVCEVDWLVGEVLAALERAGASGNTLVVFTSDNGSPQRDGTGMSGPVGAVRARFGHDPSRPWRGLKSDAWEGGHRVPLLVRWPGRVPAGAVSDAPFVHTDLYRTLATLVGHELPDDAGEDSFDQLATLTEGAAAARDHLVHHSGQGVFALRVGRWKLILGRGSGGFSRWAPPEDAPAGQLYDLEADPGEATNVYAERPDVVERLEARLAGLRASGRSVPLSGR
ncbi:MAG: arylsulfatase [Planctomycetota bacterium]